MQCDVVVEGMMMRHVTDSVMERDRREGRSDVFCGRSMRSGWFGAISACFTHGVHESMTLVLK